MHPTGQGAPPKDRDGCSTWLAAGLDRAARRLGAGQGADDTRAPNAQGADSQTLYRLTQADDLARARALCDRHATASPTGRRAVYADLVLPVVRAIEADWQAGALPFADIVAHFWTVQRLIDGLSGTAPGPTSGTARGTVLLTLPEGEDHGFGLGVVAEEFRAAGWAVTTHRGRGNRQVIDQVAAQDFAAIGLSVGHDGVLHGLADLVQDLRIAARNPRLRVILGGNVLATRPAGFGFLGADMIARTGAEALAWLDRTARPGMHPHRDLV
jgi:methylmalonyl-CoA mutase cobalamin-binding subunit